MATGLFSLHRNLAGAVGVALSATLLDSREALNRLLYSEQQVLYPIGTEQAAETIRGVLMQDGQVGETLTQMTSGVMRQLLGERAAMGSYHVLFVMFAILAMACLIPVLLLRTGDRAKPKQEKTPIATATVSTPIPRKACHTRQRSPARYFTGASVTLDSNAVNLITIRKRTPTSFAPIC